MRIPKPWMVFVLLTVLIACNVAATPTLALLAQLPVVDSFESELGAGTDPNNISVGWFTAQDGATTVGFDRTTTPPAARPGATEPNNVLSTTMTVSVFGVVIHGFTNEARNAWVPQDWSAFGGFSFWFHGEGTGTSLFIDIIDNRNSGATTDDAERYSVTFTDDVAGWRKLDFPFESFTRKEIGNGAPNDGLTLTEVHGWAFGALSTNGQARTWYIDQVELYGTAPVRPLTVSFGSASFGVDEGRGASVVVRLSKVATETVTVNYRTADGSALAGRDYAAASGTLTFAPNALEQRFTVSTLDNAKWRGNRTVLLFLESPSGADLGMARTARVDIREDETFDRNLIDDFERGVALYQSDPSVQLSSRLISADDPLALPNQSADERVLQAQPSSSTAFTVTRPYATPQDWSGAEGLSFWLYGNNTGQDLSVTLYENRVASSISDTLNLVWSDEFDGAAGSAPDARYWSYELGDGTVNSIPGWGNDELQYYTDDPENVALDGSGNLVITTRDASSSGLTCYYGPCEYTSARLLTQHKLEFGYGRVEARVKVPAGAGLWPAFWSLGNDIAQVSWPQTGEIDIMEFVGRDPNRVFGTIHGPGYSGGQSFGRTYDVGEPVGNEYHVFTIDWQPNLIVWYIDGIEYHRATPADVAPNEWVFDHPFFLLLNMAVGGNFGGPVGSETTFPQSMLVDYVRVYANDDRSERFNATVTDNFSGWQRITLPFNSFNRAAEQPAAAPNDGFSGSEIWGFSVAAPASSNDLLIGQIRLQLDCPDEVTVSSTADSGAGSLREALGQVCRGGTVRFDQSLANQTIRLTNELSVTTDLTIDGAAAPGLAISGEGTVRVLVVEAGAAVTLRNLALRNGFGFQLAGAVLVNGQLTAERVTISNSSVTGDGQFWQGGGAIYVGGSGNLTLRDSTIISNSTTAADGGGIYGFQGSRMVVERSTISGNTAGNVGGGFRVLGDAQIENSTISGNTSTAWHGGAIFHTDGVLLLSHTTVASNTAAAYAAGGIFVGTFGPSNAKIEVRGSIIANNSGDQCFRGFLGAGTVELVSLGGNIASDNTCVLEAAADQPTVNPLLGPLADNGGPTATHALLEGSPALNAASAATCPAVDQRGVRRPQGEGCDIGAFEEQVIIRYFMPIIIVS